MRLSKKLGKKVHRNKIVVVNALKMTYVNRGIVRIGANLLLRLAKIQPSKEGVCSMKQPKASLGHHLAGGLPLQGWNQV